MLGRIASINERGFGFVKPDHATVETRGIFFHCSEWRGAMPFGDSLVDVRVSFEVRESPKGPRAVNVSEVIRVSK